MAFLSWAAYAGGRSAEANLSEGDWECLDPVADLGMDPTVFYGANNGYYIANGVGFWPFLPAVTAAAVVACKGNTLAVAFRGSDGGWLGKFADFVSGGGTQSYYFSFYAPLFQVVFSHIALNPGKYNSLLVTGHSLGGIMAEWLAHENYQQLVDTGLNISIATFGSPGTDHAPAFNTVLSDIVNFGLIKIWYSTNI